MTPSKELSEILAAGTESPGLSLHERKLIGRLIAAECSSDLHDSLQLETRGLPDEILWPADNVRALVRSVARDPGKGMSV